MKKAGGLIIGRKNDVTEKKLKSEETRKGSAEISRYLAFISYRHNASDSRAALALRRGIESYHVPPDSPIPKKRKVFRDADELPTSTDLGKDIDDALEGSAYLIPICSEEYMKSKWCLSEIRRYIALGKKDRILPVLLSGSPETAMPEEIRDLPAAVDLRNVSGSRMLEREVRQSAVPELLSLMSGDTVSRIKAQERKFRLAVSLSVLAVAASGLTGFAAYAMHTAEQISRNNLLIAEAIEGAKAAEAEADRERKSALLGKARYLAEQAQEKITEGSLTEAVATALSALPEDLAGDLPVSDEAIAVLRMALCMQSDRYQLVRSVKVDFPVERSGRISGKTNSITVSGEGKIAAIDRDTGEFTDITEGYNRVVKEVLDRGLERGYTNIEGINAGSRGYAIFHEKGKQLYSEEIGQGKEYHYTLNGEPFLADHALYNGALLAWIREPAEGQKASAALFGLEQEEAVAEIVTDTPIIAADFDAGSRVAAVEEDGTMGIYDVKTAEKLRELDGKFRFVRYYRNAPGYLCVMQDGSGCLIDGDTFEKKYTFRAPAPILSLDFCQQKDYILAVCEDDVRIFDNEENKQGSMLFELGLPEAPSAAFWKDGVTGTGTKFYLVFEDRVDFYELDPEKDMELMEGRPLFDGGNTRWKSPFYSLDGNYVFLQSGAEVSKWDVRTGDRIWTADCSKGSAYLGDSCFLSDDGRSVWGMDKSGLGIEKLDAETGEILYATKWLEGTGHNDIHLPKESPDGSLGVITTGKYSHRLMVFDTETGDLRWEYDLGILQDDRDVKACFSDDSREVRVLQWAVEPGVSGRNLVFRRMDAQNGRILEDRALTTAKMDNYKRIYLFRGESFAAAVDFSPGGKGFDSEEVTVSVVDLDSGELTASFGHHGQDIAVSQCFEGGLVLTWKEPDEENELEERCVRIGKDGPEGERYWRSSPEGRRLFVTPETLRNFRGEEAFISLEGEMRRISDDVLLLGTGGMKSSEDVAAAPDGSSLCLSSGYKSGKLTTALLLYASSPEKLVLKAENRMKGEMPDSKILRLEPDGGRKND